MQKSLLRLGIIAALMICLVGSADAAKSDACRLDENGASCTTNLPCPAVIERNEHKTDLFDVEYPRICGMNDTSVQERINAVLQQRVDAFITQVSQAAEDGKDYPAGTKFTGKMEYQVHRQDAELLSLTLQTYQFTGGAHGSSSLAGYTFNLSTGQLLKYVDLFNFDDASRQSLNENIIAQIRARQIPIFEPYGGVSDDPAFYLKADNKVVIVFQQYEIAPYSSGILQFEVGY